VLQLLRRAALKTAPTTGLQPVVAPQQVSEFTDATVDSISTGLDTRHLTAAPVAMGDIMVERATAIV